MDDSFNYKRIEKAIVFIKEHFKDQPSLQDIANEVNLSPFHFQRMFTEWAGTSPKNFLQYISIGYAKQLLKDSQATLFDVAYETGLSGTGRLHDLFIKIEGMTPAEFKNYGRSLEIRYDFSVSPFGSILVASTHKGICYMSFYDEKEKAISKLIDSFPLATFINSKDQMHQKAIGIFNRGDEENHGLEKIKLHLKGSPFQIKVWETLLKIPYGNLANYGNVASFIGHPNASRAVGTAIGANPVAFLIPCHRVIKASGETGEYMWGSNRKKAIIGWEGAKRDKQ